MNIEQEVAVLSTVTTGQRGSVPSAQRDFAGEGGEVSEKMSGERSELRNVVDGSSKLIDSWTSKHCTVSGFAYNLLVLLG